MGDAGSRVIVTGLRELNAALKALDADAQKAMSAALKEIAEGVASDVRSLVPRRSGRLAASYKPRGSAKGAAIAFGGSSAPYAPWIEFGGSVGKGHDRRAPHSGATKRAIVKGGRYLYPAIGDNMEDVAEKVAEAIDAIVSAYGMKVEEG